MIGGVFGASARNNLDAEDTATDTSGTSKVQKEAQLTLLQPANIRGEQSSGSGKRATSEAATAEPDRTRSTPTGSAIELSGIPLTREASAVVA